MIKAAQAATEPAGTTAGDTSTQAGAGTSGSTTSGASGQPAGTDSTGQKPAGSGNEAPQHRIEAAVKNARETTRREVEAEYAPFKGMSAEDAQVGLQVLAELRADPAKFMRELQERIGTQPGQQAAPVEEEFPEADLISKDGKLKSYTDASIKKMLDIHANRVKAQILQELRPTQEFVQSEEERRAEFAARSERERVVGAALKEARQLPHFTKENEPAILEKLQAIPKEQRKALGPVASMHMAYSLFLKDKVFPTIEADADRRVRESYTRKANAGTGSVHPASDQGGDPKKTDIKGVDGLARHMERLAESMTS